MKKTFLLSGVAAFAAQTAFAATLTVDLGARGAAIGPTHHGIFLEDINQAIEGGLYAELIRNRSFEDEATGPTHWSLETTDAEGAITLVTNNLLNAVQKRALGLTVTRCGESGAARLVNPGYWGINAVKDTTYTLSFWAKAEKPCAVTGALRAADGSRDLGTGAPIALDAGGWKKYEAQIVATGDDPKASFALTFAEEASVTLDMISLFPPTFKDRPNGWRKDLMEKIIALKPQFMRFPGGCFVEGEEIDGKLWEFKWKDSVGPIETRALHYNTWRYPVSNGFGFHDYLQLAEDLGAKPLYVTSVGIWHGGKDGGFQPHDQIDAYIQDALDAIEYANGDVTTKYGAMRAANGHPAPFNLTHVEIGNENNQKRKNYFNDHYGERYIQFYRAIKAKWLNITVVANVDAFDNNPKWLFDHPVEIVDEHYFRNPRWFVDRYTKYDSYDRNGPKVYAGEYAVTKECGPNGNLNAALGEAVFLAGIERNSDVVTMNSYAPMFKNENSALWNPDMIHFDSSRVFVTPSYHVQKIYATETGDVNVDFTLTDNPFPVDAAAAVSRTIGEELVPVTEKGVYVAERRFTFRPEDGVVALRYEDRDANNYGEWRFGVNDNTRIELNFTRDGITSTLAYKYNGILEPGRTYDARITVDGSHVTCALDGKVMHEVDLYPDRQVFASATISADGTRGWVKVINPSDRPATVAITFTNGKITAAETLRLSSSAGTDENTMDHPTHVTPRELGPLVERDGVYQIDLPPFTFDVVRLKLAQ